MACKATAPALSLPFMEKLAQNAVALAQELVRIDTCNPPGGEARVAGLLAQRLQKAGFAVTLDPLAPDRPNLIARLPGNGGDPLCFSGHMDTMPLGQEPWSFDPLGGGVKGGLLRGRGACDMKGGLAALVAASLKLAELPIGRGGLLVVLTAGEETGCLGARHLAKDPGRLGKAGALLLAEPSANLPCLGHKGTLWLRALVHGKAAHASMPQSGDNAIYRAARAVQKLAEYCFDIPEHPQLGLPSINVGVISGGTKVNMVPDRASLEIDVRLLPGQDPGQVAAELAALLGPKVELSPGGSAAGAIWTGPDDPWVASVLGIMSRLSGAEVTPGGLSYFTDAFALGRALGDPPALILGPGRPEMSHQTDETCPIEQIEMAAKAYYEIGRAWLSR